MPTLSPKTTPYYGGGQVENPANVIQTSGVPSPNIDGALGTIAVDNATGAVWVLSSKVGGTSSWGAIDGGSGASGKSVAMTAGTVTISTTSVTANSLIFLTNALVGGTVGTLSVGTIVAGTSFVINSSSGTDTSRVNWLIVN